MEWWEVEILMDQLDKCCGGRLGSNMGHIIIDDYNFYDHSIAFVEGLVKAALADPKKALDDYPVYRDSLEYREFHLIPDCYALMGFMEWLKQFSEEIRDSWTCKLYGDE